MAAMYPTEHEECGWREAELTERIQTLESELAALRGGGSSPTGETPRRESDWIALSLASHKAHATLTDAMKADGSALPEAIQLLAISADRALASLERLRGDREDTDLMWALRRGLKEVRRELAAALSAPSSQATPLDQPPDLRPPCCEGKPWSYVCGCGCHLAAASSPATGEAK